MADAKMGMDAVGGAVDLDGVVDIEPAKKGVPSASIGVGNPLSIRIHSMFPGEEDHRSLLVTSSVKNPSLYEKAPRAMHYVFKTLQPGRLLQPRLDEPGGNVVYYSPAVLDDRLDVSIRLAFDDFDADAYSDVLDLLEAGAGLPVFGIGAALGGPGGAAAGSSVLAFARQAAHVVVRYLDRRVDSDNDWVATGTINLAESGLSKARAGWYLFIGDGSESRVLGLEDRNGEVAWLDPDDAYQVDVETGRLIWRGTELPVLEGDPYVLAYINGKKEPKLKAWTATAVSAALAAKFLDIKDNGLTDLTELLSTYNDVVMARQIAEIDESLKDKSRTDKEKLELRDRREALVANIQDEKFAKKIG